MGVTTYDSAIAALQEARVERLKLRDQAMAEAAKPHNAIIANLEAAIRQLKDGTAYHNGKPLPPPVKRRGRKPKINEIPKLYPMDGTVPSKFTYILKEAERFLTMAEIGEGIQRYESGQDIHAIKERFGKHAKKYERNRIIVSIGDRRSKKYGLPEWLDENNLPKPEYNRRYSIVHEYSDKAYPMGIGIFSSLTDSSKNA